jgi:Gamma-glutamyl cyclotransferase, AIG2-like
MDGGAKPAILESLANSGCRYQPTFIRIPNKAGKDLSGTSRYPTLGVEATSPQYRAGNVGVDVDSYGRLGARASSSILASASASVFAPAQDEYPVWYFSYGTLAQPQILARLLELPESESRDELGLRPASVGGGVLKTWGGRYRALVDAPAPSSYPCAGGVEAEGETGVVGGSAYRVMSREHEEVLRYYETERYEVVRCQIRMGDKGIDGKGRGEGVQGLTFRFAGDGGDLK